MSKYTNIELINLLITYKKEHKIRIPNIQKMNKEELLENCKKYKLIDVDEDDNGEVDIPIERLSKKQMQQDIEIFFLKQNKSIDNLEKIPRKELIELMEEHSIPHLTDEKLQKEFEESNLICSLKNIIKYNYIKYASYDIRDYNFDEMSIEELQKFITDNNLDIDINDYDSIDNMANHLVVVYTTYCKSVHKKIDIERRTIPYLLDKIKNITLR